VTESTTDPIGEATREQMLDVFDTELAHLELEERRAGLTSWALAVALASVCWLGLSLLQQGGPSLHAGNVLLTAVACVVVLEMRSALASVLALSPFEGHTNTAIVRVFQASRYFQQNIASRVQAVAGIAKGLAGIVVLWRFGNGWHWWATVPSETLFGVLFLGSVVALISSYSHRVWASTAPQTRLTYFLTATIAGLVLLATSGSLGQVIVTWRLLSWTELRLSVLSIVALELSFQLLGSSRSKVLASELFALRRALALREVTPGEARKSFLVAVVGEPLDLKIKEIIERVVPSSREVRDRYNDLSARLLDLRRRLDSYSGPTSVEDEEEIKRLLLEDRQAADRSRAVAEALRENLPAVRRELKRFRFGPASNVARNTQQAVDGELRALLASSNRLVEEQRELIRVADAKGYVRRMAKASQQ